MVLAGTVLYGYLKIARYEKSEGARTVFLEPELFMLTNLT
jgi:hypothetical protein